MDRMRAFSSPRRRMVKAVFALGAGMLLPRGAMAEHVCIPEGFGQSCDAKIPTHQFASVGAAQRRLYWCWAASLEMIFRWYGKSITQESIASQTFGAEFDVPANPFVLMNALNRRFIDSSGSSFGVSSQIWSADFLVAQIDNGTLINRLAQQRPLVICNMTHMMVLVGLNYAQLPNGAVIVREAWVADPMLQGSVTGHMGDRALAEGFRYLFPVEMTPVSLGGQLRLVADLQVS